MNAINQLQSSSPLDLDRDLTINSQISHGTALRPLYNCDPIKDALIEAIDNVTSRYAINNMDINMINLICQYLPQDNYFIQTPILFDYNVNNVNSCNLNWFISNCQTCLNIPSPEWCCFYKHFSLLENIGYGYVAFRIRLESPGAGCILIWILPMALIIVIIEILLFAAIGTEEEIVGAVLFYEMIICLIITYTYLIVRSIFPAMKEHILLVDVKRHLVYAATRNICSLRYKKHFLGEFELEQYDELQNFSIRFTRNSTRGRNPYMVTIFNVRWCKGMCTSRERDQMEFLISDFKKFYSYYKEKKNQWECDKTRDLKYDDEQSYEKSEIDN